MKRGILKAAPDGGLLYDWGKTSLTGTKKPATISERALSPNP